MGISIDYRLASLRLCEAVEWAESNKAVPDEWVERTARLAELPGKTYTVALGTGLLARATDSRVDVLALKESSGPNAYSARGLAHQVLVPAAVEFGFDLRATGREPLNNQPFFRYDRIDDMGRVRFRETHKALVEALREANELDEEAALGALAAFVRQRQAAVASQAPLEFESPALTLGPLMHSVRQFVDEDAEGGKRAQALVAAVFDLVYDEVRTSRINDPSRHFPADVWAFRSGESVPLLAAEVRAKAVTSTEVVRFCQVVAAAGISHAVVVVLAQRHDSLSRPELVERAFREAGVLLTVVEGADELLLSAFSWGGRGLDDMASMLPRRLALRLQELEVRPDTLKRWANLCTEAADGEERGGPQA